MIRAHLRRFRGKHAVRLRGTHPTTGESVDTTTFIPREVFDRASVNPQARGRREQEQARKVAEAYVLALVREVNQPTAPRLPGEMTFAQLWELYARRQRSQLDASTIDRSRKYALRATEFFDNKLMMAPSKISAGGLEEYRDWRLGDGRSPATVWRELGFLRQLLRWALAHSDETGVRSIAVDRLPAVKGKRGVRSKRALTPAEFFKLYDATFHLPRSGDVLRRILIFGVCSRLRKTPLLAMRGEFIDRAESWLRVPAVLNKGRGDDYRDIAFPLPGWALAVTDDLPRRGPLWPSKVGKMHTPDDADALRSAARAIGKLPLRDEILTTLAVKYQIRAEDVAAMTWGRVNLDASTIGPVRVRRHAVTVTIAAADLELLRRLHRESAGDLLFPSSNRPGQPISKRIIFRVLGRADRLSVPNHAPVEVPMSWLDGSLKKLCRLADVLPISLHDLRRTGNSWLLSHRCERHTAPVEEIVRERLLEHVPGELAAAYNFIDDDTLREAVDRYDCILDEHQRQSGVVRFTPRRVSRR